MSYPPHLSKLIEHFKKLPGVGQKSAERFAFKVLEWPPTLLDSFSKVIEDIPSAIHYCSKCGALAEKERCFFCDHPQRSTNELCIVAHPKDIFSIEETHSYKGLYHVLGGLISPMQHQNEEIFDLKALKAKIQQYEFEEIIIALDSTVEGDATTLYLKKELNFKNSKVSRLAFGIPMGSSLEYIDGSTLSRALLGRRGF